MEKKDWTKNLPENAGTVEMLKAFMEKAASTPAKVLRASSSQEAAKLAVEEMKESGVKRVSGVKDMDLIDIDLLKSLAASEGIEYTDNLDRDVIEKADVGLSQFDLGIRELGSIVQDASALQNRLVSMLPPIHIALLPSKAVVENFADALKVIEKTYQGNPPNYLSVVTGPSRTADIERVLTIGVHGPGRLIIIMVD